MFDKRVARAVAVAFGNGHFVKAVIHEAQRRRCSQRIFSGSCRFLLRYFYRVSWPAFFLFINYLQGSAGS